MVPHGTPAKITSVTCRVTREGIISSELTCEKPVRNTKIAESLTLKFQE